MLFSVVIRIALGNKVSSAPKLIQSKELHSHCFSKTLSFSICNMHFVLQKVYINRDWAEKQCWQLWNVAAKLNGNLQQKWDCTRYVMDARLCITWGFFTTVAPRERGFLPYKVMTQGNCKLFGGVSFNERKGLDSTVRYRKRNVKPGKSARPLTWCQITSLSVSTIRLVTRTRVGSSGVSAWS